MKLRKTKKGFTIVELVIVIGVIGILTGILIPTFVNVTQKAEEAALKSNLANAYSAYVADAADGKVESAQKIFKSDGTDADADTYYVDLIKQEEIVLIGGTGNKDAGKQYKFNLDKSEWQEITVTDNQIALNNTQLMLAYDDSNYSKYKATDAADHYFRIQYGTYLVYGTVNRAA